jgi:hypothetical protein
MALDLYRARQPRRESASRVAPVGRDLQPLRALREVARMCGLVAPGRRAPTPRSKPNSLGSGPGAPSIGCVRLLLMLITTFVDPFSRTGPRLQRSPARPANAAVRLARCTAGAVVSIVASRRAHALGLIGIDSDDDHLAAQLGALRWTVDSRARLKIESKGDMCKRGLPSPNRG